MTAFSDAIHPRHSPMTRQGSSWAVATGHEAGATAALRILRSGGNVVDAAIAASAVLTVAMPHATSLGGDAFFLVRSAADGIITGLNASGCAPRTAMPGTFAGDLPAHGPSSCVVPGLVRGWSDLHQRRGRMQWTRLFDEAVELATAGFRVSRGLARNLAASAGLLKVDAGASCVFFRDGRVLCEDDLLRQSALARTLQTIAEQGASTFYQGHIAQRLVHGIHTAGGLIQRPDLAGFEAEWVAPLALTHGESVIHVMPPNSLGVLMLMQLQALQDAPAEERLRSAGSHAARQVRAMRAAFSVGLPTLGDPRHMNIAGSDLLDDPYRAAVTRKFDEDSVSRYDAPGSGTACVTVADREGNAVCIVQSIFNPFGSHFLEPSTGIVLNNRISGFSVAPGLANSIGPGRRCAHTLNPVMVTRGSQLQMVYASPGGVSQTTTGAQVLTNVLDRRMHLADAIAAPRWAIDRRQDVLLEPVWATSDAHAMKDAGVAFRQEDSDYFFGSATAIEMQPGGELLAVADARREAAAAAV